MKDKRPEKLKFVFAADSISGEQVLATFIGALNKLGLPTVFSMHGVDVGVKALEKNISKKKSWPSGVVSNGLELRFGILPALAHSFLTIQEAGCANKIAWEELVAPFLSVKGLIQAWISDVEYDFWQNAKDPMEYACAGRSFSQLPQKTNGLPAPLTQMEIDTSGNPGRIELRQGYVEAIGSTMWLSDLFWENVGKNRASTLLLLRAQGFIVFEGAEFVKVVASESCFHDDKTIEMQRTLRGVLFD
ncbi:hypothetical protein [Pseudomonas sp. PDM25]|uniref:hypothetical protein n=1 Tax=Pseudomonas sp. PDM25 TaxID=2854772 RepID=UPI001C470C08|nr:hypothetical protein [Pseudomonas sp. PDM25]MBV7511271.1 hypothetical protein [Pseudomonas sp. PDM25]